MIAASPKPLGTNLPCTHKNWNHVQSENGPQPKQETQTVACSEKERKNHVKTGNNRQDPSSSCNDIICTRRKGGELDNLAGPGTRAQKH